MIGIRQRARNSDAGWQGALVRRTAAKGLDVIGAILLDRYMRGLEG